MILTEAPGLTPEEVERLITFPIETDMGGLPDVKQVRSLSKTGLYQVIVIFEDYVDTYFARNMWILTSHGTWCSNVSRR
jgi:cobalt-zinc-cadmium resistance protein CzcA